MSGARDVLDGTALLCWGRTCLVGLEHRREEINALNVFPVPDADTGTNLLATMRAAVEAAEAAGASRANTEASEDGSAAHAVAVAMAHGATVGARGNSGIILSQVLRGVAEAVDGGPFTADSLRVALTRASELVREALSVPIEGTILTVLDCAAAAAAGCPDRTLAGVAIGPGAARPPGAGLGLRTSPPFPPSACPSAQTDVTLIRRGGLDDRVGPWIHQRLVTVGEPHHVRWRPVRSADLDDLGQVIHFSHHVPVHAESISYMCHHRPIIERQCCASQPFAAGRAWRFSPRHR